MNYNLERERIAKNAESSMQMEGFQITPEIRRNAQRIAAGEVSIEKFVKELIQKQNGKRADEIAL